MRYSRWLALGGALALTAAACAGGDVGENRIESTASDGNTTTTVLVEPANPGVSDLTTPPGFPEVDLAVHDVPLEDVHFDTFDGGSVPLSESTPELRAALRDAIPPIDAPVYGGIGDGDWLEPADLVLGYVAGNQAYAYPFKILNFHEIVNDELAGIPVLVTYCPLCRSGVVYDRRVGGEVLSFGNTSALYESDLVMVDRTTGSYWWQVAGTAIVGSLSGTALAPLPSAVATWSDWTEKYPETLVLTRATGFERPYELDSFVNYADFLDRGQFAFPVGEAARDPRLPSSALVVGVAIDGEAQAYPVDGLTDPIVDEVGGQPIVVFPIDGGGSVFRATVAGEALQFERRDENFVDVGTGSTWDATGLARSGAWEGTRLEAIPSRTTFWFAFVGAFPEVEVYPGG